MAEKWEPYTIEGSSWLRKAPAMAPGAGITTLAPPIGFGAAPTGPTSYRGPGRANSVAPAGDGGGRPGRLPSIHGDGHPRRVNPPPIVIADVDMNQNWYSPFQPVAPFGPPYLTTPREWDYPVGFNLDLYPQRLQNFAQLRGMSQGWGVLRAIIETRKDQLLRMPWVFQVKGDPSKKDKRIDELNEFFYRPDGKNRYNRWMRLLLEDLLVIDALTLYKYRAVNGKPLSLEVLDGATIKPLIDDAGRRPDYPSPAFQQIIKGLPMVNFTEAEILYAPMRPMPQMPLFGYSPVEQIFVEASAALKRTIYQSNFYSEGTMPEMIMTVPKEWTPQQVAMFQAHFDAQMVGNIAMKSRIKFMPGDMKPYDIKNANGDALKSEIDEWWVRIACFAFSISPQPFVKMMNRATAAAAAHTAEEEGLYPLMRFWKEDVLDPIIQEDFGYKDIEHTWTQNPEVDQERQSKVLIGYVKNGILKPNEAREELGVAHEEDGDSLIIVTGTGAVPLKGALERAEKAAEKPAPAALPGGGANPRAKNSPLSGSPGKPRAAIRPKPVAKAIAAPSSDEEGEGEGGEEDPEEAVQQSLTLRALHRAPIVPARAKPGVPWRY